MNDEMAKGQLTWCDLLSYLELIEEGEMYPTVLRVKFIRIGGANPIGLQLRGNFRREIVEHIP